uniref:Uncharacterized protein n=1 Tax=Nymphaea colorata TaxID=210225 RepID=A0A5K1DZI3_9MAGN
MKEPGVGTAVLEHLPTAGKDDESDLGIAEDGELMRLLQQPVPPIGERNLPVGGVLNPPHLNTSTSYAHLNVISTLSGA